VAEPERYLAEYGRRFANVFNADDAAAWIRDELFRRSVEEPAPEGKNRGAFSSGGNAAGKSTAIEFSRESTAAQAVLDSIFASP